MWNYRVMKTTIRGFGDHVEDQYGIHEVYYDERGTPQMYSENPIAPIGETPEELRADLERQLQSIGKPILTPEDFPKSEKIDYNTTGFRGIQIADGEPYEGT